jgi:hypothetical protein
MDCRFDLAAREADIPQLAIAIFAKAPDGRATHKIVPDITRPGAQKPPAKSAGTRRHRRPEDR